LADDKPYFVNLHGITIRLPWESMSATLPLEKMTLAEKLQAMEELWADLSRNDNFESPAWHAEVLEARRNETNFIDWETAKHSFARAVNENRHPSVRHE
jgi:hypothetical protein